MLESYATLAAVETYQKSVNVLNINLYVFEKNVLTVKTNIVKVEYIVIA